MVPGQGAELAIFRLGIETASQQQCTDKLMFRIWFAFGAQQLGLPKRTVKSSVVRHHRTATGEICQLPHDLPGFGCISQHCIADTGQLLDESRHPGTGFHQALVLANDCTIAQQYHRNFGGTGANAR